MCVQEIKHSESYPEYGPATPCAFGNKCLAQYSGAGSSLDKHRTLLLEVLVWCELVIKASQPQRIISGLRETFVKRYIVQRTNKAELRPEVQSEKVKSCRENLERAIKTETDT